MAAKTPRAAIIGAARTAIGLNDAAPDSPNSLANVLAWASGLRLSDVTLFEINEAFAAQSVACSRALGLDEEIVNVYGPGISLGHPIAATGARLHRRGGGMGVLSTCAGSGMGEQS
jgi:acetyl-CoA acetyltransferase